MAQVIECLSSKHETLSQTQVPQKNGGGGEKEATNTTQEHWESDFTCTKLKNTQTQSCDRGQSRGHSWVARVELVGMDYKSQESFPPLGRSAP
jgi:hypothetical protein